MHGSTERPYYFVFVFAFYFAAVDLFVSLVAMTMGFDTLYAKGLAKESERGRKRGNAVRSVPVELEKLHNSRNILLFNSSVHWKLPLINADMSLETSSGFSVSRAAAASSMRWIFFN